MYIKYFYGPTTLAFAVLRWDHKFSFCHASRRRLACLLMFFHVGKVLATQTIARKNHNFAFYPEKVLVLLHNPIRFQFSAQQKRIKTSLSYAFFIITSSSTTKRMKQEEEEMKRSEGISKSNIVGKS